MYKWGEIIIICISHTYRTVTESIWSEPFHVVSSGNLDLVLNRWQYMSHLQYVIIKHDGFSFEHSGEMGRFILIKRKPTISFLNFICFLFLLTLTLSSDQI